MLAEATRLHTEALTHLDKPKAGPLPQLREAERLLNEAEILASDAASYVDATQMGRESKARRVTKPGNVGMRARHSQCTCAKHNLRLHNVPLSDLKLSW